MDCYCPDSGQSFGRSQLAARAALAQVIVIHAVIKSYGYYMVGRRLNVRRTGFNNNSLALST